jgi:hypothetical protein
MNKLLGLKYSDQLLESSSTRKLSENFEYPGTRCSTLETLNGSTLMAHGICEYFMSHPVTHNPIDMG